MRGRKPTRAEKILIKKWHLNPDNWFVVSSTHAELKIIQKFTDKIRVIPEGAKS